MPRVEFGFFAAALRVVAFFAAGRAVVRFAAGFVVVRFAVERAGLFVERAAGLFAVVERAGLFAGLFVVVRFAVERAGLFAGLFVEAVARFAVERAGLFVEAVARFAVERAGLFEAVARFAVVAAGFFVVDDERVRFVVGLFVRGAIRCLPWSGPWCRSRIRPGSVPCTCRGDMP